MSTVIICWADEHRPASPVGTVPQEIVDADTERAVNWAKEWCQTAVNREEQDVLPLLEWKHYLSRGSGPGTAHYVAKPDIPEKDETFEIWIVGEVK
jgi:hypothetical protein